MSTDVMATLLGAIVGAILTGTLTYFQNLWSRKVQLRAERGRQRLTLVREIMRYRLDEEHLIGPLNELPLVFGDDDEVLRLYRELIDAVDGDRRTHILTNLVNHLAGLVDLSQNVRFSDIQRGLRYAG